MAERKNSKLFFNFFSLGIVQGINSLLQLIVLPYVIGRIGVDRFGVVAVVQVVTFFLSTFSDYGFNQTATRDIALYHSDISRVSTVFSRVVFSKFVLCLAAFLILTLLVALIPFFREHSTMCFLAFGFVIGQSFLVNWFFQGLEKMHFMAIATLVGRLVFVASVFVFIKGKEDDILYLLFSGIGNIVAAVVSIVLAFRLLPLKLVRPSRDEVTRELREGWQIMIANISINACQHANIFILRYFTNDLVTGYYSIAERVFFTLKQGLVVFSQSVYPVICKLAVDGKNGLSSFFKKIFLPFFLIVTAIAAVLFSFSPEVTMFFTGHQNDESSFLLRMFCVAVLIVCLNIPFTLVLLATDKRTSYSRIYITASLLNILLNILLCYYLKSTGTVLAILITELFITTGVIAAAYSYYQQDKKQLTA